MNILPNISCKYIVTVFLISFPTYAAITTDNLQTYVENWDVSDFEMMDKIVADLGNGKLPEVLRPNVQSAIDQLRMVRKTRFGVNVGHIDNLIHYGLNALATNTDPGPAFYFKAACFSSKGDLCSKAERVSKELEGQRALHTYFLPTFADVSIAVFNRLPPELYVLGCTTLDLIRFDGNEHDALLYMDHDLSHVEDIQEGFNRYIAEMRTHFGLSRSDAITLTRATQRRFDASVQELSKTSPKIAEAVEGLLFVVLHEMSGDGGWSTPETMLRRLSRAGSPAVLEYKSDGKFAVEGAGTYVSARTFIDGFFESEKTFYPDVVCAMAP